MELLAGRDLAAILEDEGPQPIARAVGWIVEACDAIGEAHRLGIVHRDLKPSNLFLAEVDGRSLVKVVDFGIAKRVSTQEVAITLALAPLGTPQYMSPEQVRCAKDVDGRTDVWSLAVTLYELLCGVTPFAHESVTACIAAIIADPVPDPRRARADLPDELVAVLLRALEKEADDRYPSVEAFVEALAPFASGGAVAGGVAAFARVVEAESPPRELAESGYFPTVPPVPVREPPDVPAARRRLRSSLGVAIAAAFAVGAVVLAARASAPEARASAQVGGGATSLAAALLAPAPLAPALPAPALSALPAPGSALPTPQALAPLVEVDATPAPARAPTVRAVHGPRASRPPPVPSVHGGLSSPGF
jgi:serine/threonine-protein kinase